MDKDDAELKADRLVELLLTHQQGIFGPASTSAAGGAYVALAVAALRKTLIDELQKQ